MSETVLILGATGGIGGAVARAALARGWPVRALARDAEKARAGWTDPARPEWIAGDAMVPDDIARAARGVSVIVHAVNPRGTATGINWSCRIDGTIAAARTAGARVVLPGTIYNYDVANTPVVDEHTPQDPRGKKGAIRAALERRLAAAAPEVPSLIVRAGDFFGPGARRSWFSQALAKPPLRAIQNPGRDGVGHAWAYLPDLAEAMVRLIALCPDRLRPAEKAQLAGLWDADGRGMIAAIRSAAGRPDLPVRRLPWWLFRLAAPFGGFPREALEVKPFWRHPLRLDNTRLLALLGEEPRTPLDQAVARALAG